MTKFQRHLAFSTTAMLIASLAACSKHTLRETPKAATTLSTSANPLKAEKEDAAATEKAKADALAAKSKESEGKELTDAEKDALLVASKAETEARAAGKGLSADQVADLFANDVQGAKIVETPAAPDAAVPPAQTAGAPDSGQAAIPLTGTTAAETAAKPEAQTATSSAAPAATVDIAAPGAATSTDEASKAAATTTVTGTGMAAPIVAGQEINKIAAGQPGSKRLAIVLPVPGSRGGETEVATTVQTAPIANVTADDQAAVKRAFVKALIAPTLRLNAQTMLQRQRVIDMQKKMADKVELSVGEKADLAKLKLDYLLLDSKSTIEDLLARVDAVQMSFLIAPLAIKTKWNTEGQVTESLIASRIQELNVSVVEDKVRFRSARLALKSSTNGVNGVELMKSFLAYNAADKNLTHEALIATVTEIAALTQEPEMIAEIDRARLKFVEDARELVKAKDRN